MHPSSLLPAPRWPRFRGRQGPQQYKGCLGLLGKDWSGTSCRVKNRDGLARLLEGIYVLHFCLLAVV